MGLRRKPHQDERCLKIIHTTLIRCVFRFSDALKQDVRPHLGEYLTSCRLYKMVIKVKGKWTYLYWAVDREGKKIDFYLMRNRDSKAALSFFSKIIRINSPTSPYVMNVDKNYAYIHEKSKLDQDNT